jgi:predicted ribonuclease toxin of YeeF-YezG toxin-antitoxin module
VIKGIKKKLTVENAVVTQADKGKTTVIINHNKYSKKVNDFISANNFKIMTRNPTEKLQKLIHKVMQECNLIIDKCRI